MGSNDVIRCSQYFSALTTRQLSPRYVGKLFTEAASLAANATLSVITSHHVSSEWRRRVSCDFVLQSVCLTIGFILLKRDCPTEAGRDAPDLIRIVDGWSASDQKIKYEEKLKQKVDEQRETPVRLPESLRDGEKQSRRSQQTTEAEICGTDGF